MISFPVLEFGEWRDEKKSSLVGTTGDAGGEGPEQK